jgi:hypothetical protein
VISRIIDSGSALEFRVEDFTITGMPPDKVQSCFDSKTAAGFVWEFVSTSNRKVRTALPNSGNPFQ